MVYITRKETFSAHKLSRPDWSNEKNAEVFGKCSNPNYMVTITINQGDSEGEINPETGFANLAEISVLLKNLFW